MAMSEGLDKTIIDHQTVNIEIGTINLLIISNIKKLYFEHCLKKSRNIDNSGYKKKIKDYKISLKDFNKFMEYFEIDKSFSKHPLLIIAVLLFSYIRAVARKKIKFSLYQKERDDCLDIFNEKRMVLMKKIGEEDLVCYKFLKAICSCVEVKRSNGILELYYFKTLSKCYYLSMSSKDYFIKNVDRTSTETKLSGLYEEMEYFITEMNHNQRIFSNYFSLYKYLGTGNSFYNQLTILLLTAAINILLLVDINQKTINKYKYHGLHMNKIWILAIVAIIVTFINFLLYLFLIYPLKQEICQRRFLSEKGEKINRKLNIIDRIRVNFGRAFLFQNDVFTYLFHFFCLSLGMSVSIAFYSIDLLAIINLSVTLKYVLNSTTRHIMHLAATLTLAFFVMYSYAMFLTIYFYNDVSSASTTCPSVWLCFLNIVDSAFTNGQGTAGMTNQPNYGPGNYSNFYGKFFVDLSFFLIVNTVFLNIIFGIIIDTFGEMRAKNSEFGINYFFLKIYNIYIYFFINFNPYK